MKREPIPIMVGIREQDPTLGVNLTRVPGLGPLTVQGVFSEVGSDLSRWPTENPFAWWLGLCPDDRISGGRGAARDPALDPRSARPATRVLLGSARGLAAPLQAGPETEMRPRAAFASRGLFLAQNEGTAGNQPKAPRHGSGETQTGLAGPLPSFSRGGREWKMA